MFFFDLLCTSSNHGDPEIPLTMTNLEWQLENNPDSIVSAYQFWTKALQAPYNDLMNDGGAHEAMYLLLSGQRHNASVMDLYRAFFREDRWQLFELVGKVLGPQASNAAKITPKRKGRNV